MRFAKPALAAIAAAVLFWYGLRSGLIAVPALAAGVFMVVVAMRLTGQALSPTPAPGGESWFKHPSFPRYLLYSGVTAFVVWAVVALVIGQAGEISGDKIIVSFLAGPAFLLWTLLAARLQADAWWMQLAGSALVCFVYFFAIGIPAGKAKGLLPTRATPGRLWSVQFVLVGLHLLWGVAVLFLLKA